ncbi:histone-lysine N-methyltransferase SETD1A [Sparus aurata]|uniref:histone-lysine N-methyltransferase SETD1A n=1 Tax=Sparus aurata TaxID=8175 RepID=UPI0011C0DFA1|nr:histone-lysine N-methyltransferase SETD1A-like [Sparus aurata]
MNGSITIGGPYQETGYSLNPKMRVRQPATLPLGTAGDPGFLSVSSTRGKGYGAYVQFKAMGKATCDSAGIGQSPSKAPVLGCQTVQSATLLPSLQRNNRLCDKRFPRRCPGYPRCRGRQGMEESYETFEEELGPPRADPPPQKPVRQIRRPEMYATRKVREEMPPVPQQPRAEPRILPREPSFPRQTSFPKTSSIQNPMQIETPWENVTLNRCLFVAIAILVLTSGCQRLNETLRGQRPAEEEEEYGLTARRSGALRRRVQPAEPETSLWEVMLWWLPDLDDEDDEEEDEDGVVKRGRSKRGAAAAQTSRGLRNKPLPVKNLMRRREGRLKDRRAKKDKDEEIRDKKEKEKTEEPKEAADDEEEEEGNEEAVPERNKKSEEQKEKKKAQTG